MSDLSEKEKGLRTRISDLEAEIHTLWIEIADGRRATEKVSRDLEHRRQWDDQRWHRLSKWAREELTGDMRTRFFNIAANGTADSQERAFDFIGELARVTGERDEALKHLGIMVDANVCIVFDDPLCGDCYVCDARAARALLAEPRFKIGDKVITPGSGIVGEVLNINEARGVLVRWPPSGGENVKPCWDNPDDLRLAEPQAPDAPEKT